jgi:hypothetical protein
MKKEIETLKKIERQERMMKEIDVGLASAHNAVAGADLPRLTNIHNGREIVIVKRQITDTGTILYHAHRQQEGKVFSVFDKCLCRFDLEHWVFSENWVFWDDESE